jgi:hypothetical protein
MAIPMDVPVIAAYYYKTKWGYQDEFLALFRKNHYPILMAQIKSGRLLKFEAYEPRFHGDGRSDWTFLTIITFKNWQAFGDNSGQAELIEQMYSDQETYKREERRRFEILEAHWDVPLKPASFEEKK